MSEALNLAERANEADGLPAGWTQAAVSDLFDSWGGATPSTSQSAYWGIGMPWISSGDVKQWRLTESAEQVTQLALHETRLRIVPSGSTIVVIRSGVLVHSLPVAVTTCPVVINQDLKAFVSPEPGLSEWLALALRWKSRQILETNRKDGTTVQSIRFDALKSFSLHLPPLAEQRRIVAKVEQVLARVNAARERLARVPTILKRFRQSVLAAACSGRLTADWRAESSVESDKNCDTDLPSEWKRRPLAELCAAFEYGTSKKSEPRGEIPVLRMGNLRDGKIDWSDLVYSTDRDEIKKYALSPNTVLFNRTNSPELVGKTAIYHGERPAIFAGYLIRVRHGNELEPCYLNFCLNSPNFKEYCSQVKTDGVSQSNINAKKLAQYSFPWCKVDEQREIIRRVERLFALADAIEGRSSVATQRVERITQAVLAKAFRGELVPTEAELAEAEGRDYETAEALLDRIRRERATAEPFVTRQPRLPRKRQLAIPLNGATPRNGHAKNGAPLPEPSANGPAPAVARRPQPADKPAKSNGNPAAVQSTLDNSMAVVRDVFADGQPRPREQALRDLAQALGHQRLGKRAREQAAATIRTATRRGILTKDAGHYRLTARKPTDYDRQHLIRALLSTLNGQWTDRAEAIRATAHYLGHIRVGPSLRKALRSAINGAIRRGLLEAEAKQIRSTRKPARTQ